MAADNRNFVNKFANKGGGDVLVEDKRLEELKSATAKTASQISTSTDYVPLQDTDGNLVKINPASFEEAVRNVLGSLLANNDKGTTISGIPALSGSGASLDFGSVTPANLASVLGVNIFKQNDYFNGDLNSLWTGLDHDHIGRISLIVAGPSATNKPAAFADTYCFVLQVGNMELCWSYWDDNNKIFFRFTRMNALGISAWREL